MGLWAAGGLLCAATLEQAGTWGTCGGHPGTRGSRGTPGGGGESQTPPRGCSSQGISQSPASLIPLRPQTRSAAGLGTTLPPPRCSVSRAHRRAMDVPMDGFLLPSGAESCTEQALPIFHTKYVYSLSRPASSQPQEERNRSPPP